MVTLLEFVTSLHAFISPLLHSQKYKGSYNIDDTILKNLLSINDAQFNATINEVSPVLCTCHYDSICFIKP